MGSFDTAGANAAAGGVASAITHLAAFDTDGVELSGGDPAYSRKSVAYGTPSGGSTDITASATFNIPEGTMLGYVKGMAGLTSEVSLISDVVGTKTQWVFASSAANSDITITARDRGNLTVTDGLPGMRIRIRLLKVPSGTSSGGVAYVDVDGDTLTITIEPKAAFGVAVATASEIKADLEAHPLIARLVTVEVEGDGSGLVDGPPSPLLAWYPDAVAGSDGIAFDSQGTYEVTSMPLNILPLL